MRRVILVSLSFFLAMVPQACQQDEATAPHPPTPRAQVAAASTVGYRIAFMSSRDGRREIYSMNADGSAQTRLTNDAAGDDRPAWSPDGRHIAFSTNRDGHFEIYLMMPDGSAQTRLTRSANVVANLLSSWSPDSRHIAFASDSFIRHIDVINVDGSGLTQLTYPSGGCARDDAPSWSPDGQRIAFSSNVGCNSEIFVMNADGSAVTQLTNDPGFDGEPAWSPDGSKIAFTSNRDGNSHIYVMNADGSAVTQLTSEPASDFEADWSPDGSRIAFQSNRDGNLEIYVMNADGSAPTRLTNNAADDMHPSWSPAMAVGLRLTFLTQPPESVEVNLGMSPQVRVAVTDSTGNPVPGATDTVTIALSNNSTGATLAGTTSVAAVDGIATFDDLRVDRVGRGYTLDATAPLLGIVRSTPFSVYAPARLVFVTQPPDSVQANVTISPAVRVAVTDSAGNAIPGASDAVTLSLAPDSTGVMLLGTTSVAAVDGIATFSDLRVDRPAKGLTLVATAPDRTGATSVLFAARVSFTSVRAGGRHSCAITTAGEGFCWGLNSSGQLGDGTLLLPNRESPAPVAGGLSFAMISVGSAHTCGVTPAGAAYCWGAGSSGQRGDGSFEALQGTPVPVAGGLRFVTISAGGNHTCGVTGEGTAYCWGDNFSGQLGDGGVESRQATPAPVAGGLTFTTITTGDSHTCAVTNLGTAFCWGYNGSGQLGDGTVISRPAPAPVASALSFVTVSAGSVHTCGVTTDGTAYCWGSNTNGQLGNGTTVPGAGATPLPVPVAGALSFTAIGGGGAHTCGLTSGGTGYCWGANSSGQLGDGTGAQRTTPAAVVGGVTFTAISAGNLHTCGVAANAGAYCWGYDASGQLGDGTTNNSLAPVRVVQ